MSPKSDFNSIAPILSVGLENLLQNPLDLYNNFSIIKNVVNKIVRVK